MKKCSGRISVDTFQSTARVLSQIRSSEQPFNMDYAQYLVTPSLCSIYGLQVVAGGFYALGSTWVVNIREMKPIHKDQLPALKALPQPPAPNTCAGGRRS